MLVGGVEGKLSFSNDGLAIGPAVCRGGLRISGGSTPTLHSDKMKFSFPVNAGTKRESVGIRVDFASLPPAF